MCLMSAWYVHVRVPVLSGGWVKPRCARRPGEFIAKNMMGTWDHGSRLAIHPGRNYHIKGTKEEGKGCIKSSGRVASNLVVVPEHT